MARTMAPQSILAPHHLAFALTQDGLLRNIPGAVLALVAILGRGIGGMLRNSVGGIMPTLILILPVVAAILSGQNKVIAEMNRFLPSQTGANGCYFFSGPLLMTRMP
jgi:hypothetical protein